MSCGRELQHVVARQMSRARKFSIAADAMSRGQCINELRSEVADAEAGTKYRLP